MPISKREISICKKAIVEASKEIMKVYQQDFATEHKSDGSPVTVADKRSSAILLAHLSQFSNRLISEEADIPAYSVRKNWEDFWLIDPLDGTKEFVHRNDEFCINLGYIEKGKPVFGVLAIPVFGICLYGGTSHPVTLWDYLCDPESEKPKRLEPEFQNSELRIIGSRSVPQNLLTFEEAMKPHFQKITHHFRGSAVKFLDLALSKVDVYPRKSPTMEWDTAAGHALLKGLGGDLTHWDDTPFVYGKENLLNPHFVAKTANFIQHIPSLPQDL